MAAVRARRRGERPPTTAPLGMRELWDRCRRTRRALFDEGGATIDTPDPAAGPPALFARTLVQPDGDVACFVTERYADDAGLRLQHQQRTTAWFDQLHATVDGVAATTRSVTRWVSLVVVAVITASATALSTIVIGVVTALVTGVAVPVFVRQGLRFAISRLLSRTGRPR